MVLLERPPTHCRHEKRVANYQNDQKSNIFQQQTSPKRSNLHKFLSQLFLSFSQKKSAEFWGIQESSYLRMIWVRGGASTHGMVSWGLGPRPTTTCQLTIYLSPNLHQLTVYTYLSFGLYSFTCNNMYLSKCCKYLGLKKDIHITISILLFIS